MNAAGQTRTLQANYNANRQKSRPLQRGRENCVAGSRSIPETGEKT